MIEQIVTCMATYACLAYLLLCVAINSCGSGVEAPPTSRNALLMTAGYC